MLGGLADTHLDLVHGADSGAHELGQPFAFGVVQLVLGGPRLTPGRENPTKAAEQLIDHVAGLRVDADGLGRLVVADRGKVPGLVEVGGEGASGFGVAHRITSASAQSGCCTPA
ncbi:hypothetical protein D3C85_1538540 [compost metagenome]